MVQLPRIRRPVYNVIDLLGEVTVVLALSKVTWA
jgi:hypothetical protein